MDEAPVLTNHPLAAPGGSAAHLPLPAGYQPLQELALRPGERILRARRASGEEVLLRLSQKGADLQSQSELLVLSQLEHPRLARLVDHGVLPGGGSFLARSFVPGDDLGRWARGRSQREIGVLVARLCGALAHLHHLGFAHADLKPGNVIVDAAGEPTLTDFGLARRSGTAGALSGTLYAVAPEQLQGAPADAHSDLFALGALLHQLLVRKRASAQQFYARFPAQDFFTASETSPSDLPEWARDLVEALLARAPSDRPPSASVVGRRLAARLGLSLDAGDKRAPLAWPFALGREQWIASFLADLESEGRAAQTQGHAPRARWIELPSGEDLSLAARELRLRAAVAGLATHDLGDLSPQSTAGLEQGPAALERLRARAFESTRGEWVFARLPAADEWAARAAHWLERAGRQQGAGGAGLVFVCAAGAAGDLAQRLPAVDLEVVQRFVEREFVGAPSPLRADFAEWLLLSCGGSASALDQVLARAFESGLLLSEGERARLRPGPLPPADSHALDKPLSPTALGPLAQRCQAALLAADGALDLSEVQELVEAPAASTAAALIEATRAGVLCREDPRWRALREVSLSAQEWRNLHQGRAVQLRGRGAAQELCALQELAASEPTQAQAAQARAMELLANLRERGAAELVLHWTERAQKLLARQSRLLPQELCAARALAWAALGQSERALALARAELADPHDPKAQAWRERIEGQVALARDQHERALECFQHAAELDREQAPAAQAARWHLLHTLGRHAQLIAEIDRAQAQPQPAPREWAFARSLRALSRFRTGAVPAARAELEELLIEARAQGDQLRHAALAHDLGLLERRAGSLQRAEQLFQEAQADYDAVGQLAGLALVQNSLAGLLRDSGELLRAEPLFESALELRERLGEQVGALLTRAALALCRGERGQLWVASEELERCCAELEGANRALHGPLMRARALEFRARYESKGVAEALEQEQRELADEADPRVPLALARTAWCVKQPERAVQLALEAARRARSVQQAGVEQEALLLLGRLISHAGVPLPAEAAAVLRASSAPAKDSSGANFQNPLANEDERLLALLSSGLKPDIDALRALARSLRQRGRDDRAARAFLALGARSGATSDIDEAAEEARACMARCALGLDERQRLRASEHLLGFFDPWPEDGLELERLRQQRASLEADYDMEIARLLEINHRLVLQENLPSLLGEIVEAALAVSGAERGFLVLEEHGELVLDTAQRSKRGDLGPRDMEISHSVVRQALAQNKPLRVSNAPDDPLLADAPSVAALELRSILCVPFTVSNDLRGAICIDHSLRAGAFDERSEKLVMLLADQAALAIRQVRRHEEITRLNKELRHRVADREADLAAARRALTEAGVVEPVSGLVGNSPAMRKVHELVQRGAQSALPVLICGDSGTGKELAARALHALSPRAGQAFVSENCAALTPSLIESELFGWRKGAFTGADRDREGLFERASGGTLFLDEIGELPIELQAKLLRVLENGELRRLGDSQVRKVEFRLVTATNRDLEKEVREGRFRADLFYRIHGLRIELPPLAARTEDIPLLVEHFLAREERKSGLKRRVSRAVLARLSKRRWPGNVRELANEVARLCVICSGDLDDPELVRDPGPVDERGRQLSGPVRPLAELEREAILHALEQTQGDKNQVAELLGISRAKVYQRLKEWRDRGQLPQGLEI